jgi:8-oxo-dGTP diphosphatase
MAHIENIARALIEENGKVLLCRGKGLKNWFFPGGHIEEGESAPVALVREIMEELGEVAEVARFVTASENKYQAKNGEVHEINLFFEVKLLSDNGRTSREDHLEFAWFSPSELGSILVFPVSVRDAVFTSPEKSIPLWTSEGF